MAACQVSGNTAERGGGIYNQASPAIPPIPTRLQTLPFILPLSPQGTLQMESCGVNGNAATERGAALFNGLGASLQMASCAVTRNSDAEPTASGRSSAGVYNRGSMLMESCVVAGERGTSSKLNLTRVQLDHEAHAVVF